MSDTVRSETLMEDYNKMLRENIKLKDRENKLIEALRFYAVDASKSMSGDFRSYAMFIDEDVEEARVGKDFILIKKGGKRAREVLQDLGVE